MDKISCLRAILAKLAGEDICTYNDDTICEILHKMIPYIKSAPENVSNQFNVIPIDGNNLTITNSSIIAKKTESIYQIDIVIDFTVAINMPNGITQLFNLEIPEINNFGGCVGSCFISDSVESINNQSGSLFVGGAVDNLCGTNVITTNPLEAGSYKLYGQLMFIS